MWKHNVEQRYRIEALSKKDINYLLTKYQGKGVADQDRLYLIPSNAKTLKAPTSKLYPEYKGPVGFMAFRINEVQNVKIYATRIAILKNVKYAHVVKARLNTKTVDLSKKKKANPQEFDLVTGVDKTQPDMAVFMNNKNFQIVETVEHQTPAAVEQLTQEEKDLLEAYAPDFSDPTPYMKQMSVDEAESQMANMSADDVAWQLMHNKHAIDLHDDIRLADKHIGRREASFLLLMNKNVSKSTRNDIASWLIDKAGVSFVAGPNMNMFLAAMVKKGMLSKNVLEDASRDDNTDAIYYGKITDPKKLAEFDINKYGYQLANNPHTPPEVLKKIYAKDVKDAKKPDDWSLPKYAEVNWWGTNPSAGGTPGKDFTFGFKDTMRNQNYPIEDLLTLYEKYRQKYLLRRATDSMLDVLWEREDLPTEYIWKFVKLNGYLLPPPAALPQKDFDAYWKNAKLVKKNMNGDNYSAFKNTAEHPHVTIAVLKDLLKIDLKNEKDEVTSIVINKLKELGKLTQDTVLNKVKKNLKFEGPSELLHHFGAKAWQAKGIETLKFTDAPPAQRAAIQKELQETSTHDDFTYEVLGVYNLSRAIHKDFDATAKKLGNIKKNVYHGTSMDNAAGILLSGINTGAESRTGQMFGNGFYLATSSSKAAQYASDNFSHNGMGIVFRMDVALGKNAKWKYGRPMGDDGFNRGGERSDPAFQKKVKAYAKKQGIGDYEVASWNITHDSVHAQKGMALLHDEYVVKQGNQIKINQVILIHKTSKEDT